MSIENLRKQISRGEGQSTVFVPNANKFQAVGRAVCALLNTDGGTVFCGIDDHGAVQVFAEDPQGVALRLEFELRQAIAPMSLFTASVAIVEGSPLIVLEVPSGKDRPYVFEGGVWLRFGPLIRAADRETLRDLLHIKGESLERWERRSSPAMSEVDLDKDEIRATVRDAEEGGRFRFTDRNDDLSVLRDLSVTTPEGFTQAGDVLFARSPMRRHPQCRAQFLVASDKSSDEFADNRWFEGPIVRICREMITAISALTPVRSSFQGRQADRIDRPAYNLDALREGIVNAFVHRDYAAYSGGLRVTVFTDRVEIWNSGNLAEGLTPGRLRGDHPSILVNPDIAQVFYLRSLMERVGRGTELIARASRRLGAPPPQWKESAGGVTLSIFSALIETTTHEDFNERQARLLADGPVGRVITLREYAERYAAYVSERQARRDLEDLTKRERLARTGKGAATTYRLLPEVPGQLRT